MLLFKNSVCSAHLQSSTQEAEGGGRLWVLGQSGLYIKFQVSQSHMYNTNYI